MNHIKRIIFSTLLLMIGFTVSFAQQVTQQQKTVTGTIKDATGEALIGASVIVKNQPGLGTISDVDGHFSIKANNYDVLVISYVGFEDKEIPIQGKTKLDNIVLKEESNKIDEVVIVGGNKVQRKITQTGAITTISPERLKGIASGNMTNALAGNVPGMTSWWPCIMTRDTSPLRWWALSMTRKSRPGTRWPASTSPWGFPLSVCLWTMERPLTRREPEQPAS